MSLKCRVVYIAVKREVPKIGPPQIVQRPADRVAPALGSRQSQTGGHGSITCPGILSPGLGIFVLAGNYRSLG